MSSSSFPNLKIMGLSLPKENREFMEESARILNSNEHEVGSALSNGVTDQNKMSPSSPGVVARLSQQHLYPGPPPGFQAFLDNITTGMGLFYPQRPAQLNLDDVSAELLNDDVSQSHIIAFRRTYEDILLKMQLIPSNLQGFMDVYIKHLRDFLIRRRAFPVESECAWRRMQERMQQRILQWTNENIALMKLEDLQKPVEAPSDRGLPLYMRKGPTKQKQPLQTSLRTISPFRPQTE